MTMRVRRRGGILSCLEDAHAYSGVEVLWRHCSVSTHGVCGAFSDEFPKTLITRSLARSLGSIDPDSENFLNASVSV